MNAGAVTELRRLAELDASLAERSAALRSLDAEVAAIRARAEAIEAFFSSYPEAETRRKGELKEAEAEVERRHQELAAGEQRLTEARDADVRAAAEHEIARARDHIAVASNRLLRSQSAYDELERKAAALPRELDELEAAARAVDDTPLLSGSLSEWASHAHAELFVAAGQVDAQRERVIREAHELAAMLLGEPTYGATVAQALARVEALSV